MTRWSTRRIAISAIALAAFVGAITALAQAPSVPDDVVIRLDRTACFGGCPVYSVTIDARGNITYLGTKFVQAVGRRTDTVAVPAVAALLQTAERIGFFELRDHYRTIRNADGSETMVTDLPTAIVTITSRGRTKRVEDYLGAPDALKELEQQIDDTARTRRWVRPEDLTRSESTARTLKRTTK